MDASDVKNITVKKLLENEETNHLYYQVMNTICDLASKGITCTDNGIWEIANYSYDAKQNVITILQLKGFEISSFDARISWGFHKVFDSDY